MIQVLFNGDAMQPIISMSNAAKMCFGHDVVTMTYDERVALLQRVLASRHFSILEHGTLAFVITGASRNFTHQFVRHRHMSFAQQSFHYTIATGTEIPQNPAYTTEQRDVMQIAFNTGFQAYNKLMELGLSKEEARHVLPSGILTKIFTTASVRQWLQFVQIRSCAVNCYEIREVANQVREHLTKLMPILTPYAGPTCLVDGVCHEGKKHCGKPWGALK